MTCEKCKEFVAHLSEYVDHELDESMCCCIEEHINECEECRHLVESLKDTLDSARSLKKEKLPPLLQNKILSNLKKCIKLK